MRMVIIGGASNNEVPSKSKLLVFFFFCFFFRSEYESIVDIAAIVPVDMVYFFVTKTT